MMGETITINLAKLMRKLGWTGFNIDGAQKATVT